MLGPKQNKTPLLCHPVQLLFIQISSKENAKSMKRGGLAVFLIRGHKMVVHDSNSDPTWLFNLRCLKKTFFFFYIGIQMSESPEHLDGLSTRWCAFPRWRQAGPEGPQEERLIVRHCDHHALLPSAHAQSAAYFPTCALRSRCEFYNSTWRRLSERLWKLIHCSLGSTDA